VVIRRRLLVAVLLVLAGDPRLRAADAIRTPFQVVRLWSDEMVQHLTGGIQPACSGPNAGTCARLNSGFCDGMAYFTVPPPGSAARPTMPFRLPDKEANSPRPQSFRVVIANAGSVSSLVHEIRDPAVQTIDLVFDCMFSGNEECPAGRFHLGALRTVQIGRVNGGTPIDLTASAKVMLDGRITVPLDRTLRASTLADAGAIYTVRAAVECFTVQPVPVEFVLPVRAAPSPDARALGSVVARVTAGSRMTLAYRPNEGGEIPFETDWVEHDWGYTYIRDQTFLDRKGDWYLLPPRPFPSAVWIHLPDRGEPSRVSTDHVFSLQKPVRARIRGSGRSVTLPPGNIVPVAVRGRTLEFRTEEPSDGPCWDSNDRAPRQTPRVYVVAAEEFYDPDGHLQLAPAYTRGC
jgi:hypothetical protein